MQIEIGRDGAAVEELVLAVVERPVALQGAFRLDPQLVVIGAYPSLSFPAELGIGAMVRPSSWLNMTWTKIS